MGRKRKGKGPSYMYYGQNSSQQLSMLDSMAQSYVPRNHFSLNEKLDLSESRSIEFKAGPGFIKNGFRDNVAKYICGFVNSNEDGTILLGVDNSGLVQGYTLHRDQEDYIRRQVDEAVKDISPDVFPKDYRLRLVPVLDEHGNNQGDNFVIEINVVGSNFVGQGRLYESKQGVFLRRDGSLEGPLKAKKIQEWTRRLFESEIDKLKKNERNIAKELENRKSEFDRRMKELEVKEKELENKERENRLMKEELHRKNEEIERKGDELERRNAEFEHQKSQIRHLEEDQQKSNHNSDETLRELGEIKRMLAENNGKNKSKVCSIM